MYAPFFELIRQIATTRNVTSAQWSSIITGVNSFENYHRILFNDAKTFTIITAFTPTSNECFGINIPFVGSMFIFPCVGEPKMLCQTTGIFGDTTTEAKHFDDDMAAKALLTIDTLKGVVGQTNKMLTKAGWTPAKIKELIRSGVKPVEPVVEDKKPTKPKVATTTPEEIISEVVLEEDKPKDTSMENNETTTEPVVEPVVEKQDEAAPAPEQPAVETVDWFETCVKGNSLLKFVETISPMDGAKKYLVGFFLEGLDKLGAELPDGHDLLKVMDYMETHIKDGSRFTMRSLDEGVALKLRYPGSDYSEVTHLSSQGAIDFFGVCSLKWCRYTRPENDSAHSLKLDPMWNFVGIGSSGVVNVDPQQLTVLGNYEDFFNEHESILFAK